MKSHAVIPVFDRRSHPVFYHDVNEKEWIIIAGATGKLYAYDIEHDKYFTLTHVLENNTFKRGILVQLKCP